MGFPPQFGLVLKACHDLGEAAAAAAAAATPAAMASSFESRLASECAATAVAIADHDGYRARVESLLAERSAAAAKIATLESAVLGRRMEAHVGAVGEAVTSVLDIVSTVAAAE